MHNHCLNGWLITQKNLFARRAPGGTCLSGLLSMQSQGDVAKNDSKGCGGVMRVAPIGMYYATLAAKGDANKLELLILIAEKVQRSPNFMIFGSIRQS